MYAICIEYVYAELQEVSEENKNPADPLIGQSVVVLRLNMGHKDPSKAVFLTVENAKQLYEDLGKVLNDAAAFED